MSAFLDNLSIGLIETNVSIIILGTYLGTKNKWGAYVSVIILRPIVSISKHRFWGTYYLGTKISGAVLVGEKSNALLHLSAFVDNSSIGVSLKPM